MDYKKITNRLRSNRLFKGNGPAGAKRCTSEASESCSPRCSRTPVWLFLGEGPEHFYQYVESLVGATERALD